jgi:DNA-binding LacI/PurR family transcriptional regulator/biotin operon repressor
MKKDSRSVALTVEKQLRHNIYAGRLQSNQQLPSENRLVRRYKISRCSIRKALKTLEDEGLIYKVRGKGSFVLPEEERPRIIRKKPLALNKKQILYLSFSSLYSKELFMAPRSYDLAFDGLTRELQPAHFNLLFSHVGLDWTPPPCLVNRDVSGIIFNGIVRHDFFRKYMRDMPCVGVRAFDPELDCSWVLLDDQLRSYLAVSHLYKYGHRKIGFVSNEIEEPIPAERYRGYLNALRHFKLEFREDWQIVWQRSRVNGTLPQESVYNMPDYWEYLEPAFLGKDRPTALICVDDWRALCTYQALSQHDIRVPEAVSLLGGYIGEPFIPVNMRFTSMDEQTENIYAEAAKTILETLYSRGTSLSRNV